MHPSVLKRLFDLLASLKLAVVVLIAMAVAMAFGTFVESEHGSEKALESVYHSRWFALLILLLFLNVLFSALKRFPWKRRHIGFLVTHGGILLILLGTMVTRYWGIEGRVVLVERESTRSMMIDRDAITIHPAHSEESIVLPFDWDLGHEQYPLPGSDVTFVIENRLENAEPAQDVKEASGEGSAAAEICFSAGPGQEQRQWLSAGSVETSGVKMGPLVVRLADGMTRAAVENIYKQLETRQGATAEKGTLHVSIPGGEHADVDVAEAMTGPVELPGGWSVKVLAQYAHAQVKDGQLINASDEPVNPALEVEITSPDGNKEVQKTFSKFPDFAAMHSEDGSPPRVSLKYEFGSQPDRKEILVLVTEDGHLSVIAPTPDGAELHADYQLGEKLPTPMSGVSFSVEDFYPGASLESIWKEATSEEGVPVIKASLVQADRRETFWLPFGDEPERVQFGGHAYLISFGPEEIDLGFAVTLIDFGKPTYGGTSMPSQYYSQVRVDGPAVPGGSMQHTISMNQPLSMNGFRLFQSGFRELGDGRELTILSVSKDPGVPLVYAGCIILIIGFALTFYLPKKKRKRDADVSKT